MNDARPTVSAELIAAMIDAAPDRVRRRLDQAPAAAASWDWQPSADGWSIHAGAETVTLPHGRVNRAEQLTCTCLLTPRCFHVLACLTSLQVAVAESPAGDADEIELRGGDVDSDLVECDENQKRAIRELVDQVASLLRLGVANAGVAMQSGFLRAVHQCRADGLHRLAALGLRVITGAGEFRQRAPSSDPAQLAEDIADVLETSRHLLGAKAVAGFWYGTARRKQIPVRPRKLHGLFAEPIMTRSGYSGAAVYFLGEDDRIYTASDLQPGDAQHARDAYLGGIEIGSMILPARQLARGMYLGTDLTASQDGRLGRGKGIKIVEQGQSTWQMEALAKRFKRPLPDQWNEVYAQAGLPIDARPAGWDFVYLEGNVLGAAGSELLLQPAMHEEPIRLAIENESESLCFRENLRMLSHAPGLRLAVIARVNLQEPRIASALAAAEPADAWNASEPRWELPATLGGRICLGFDEIQRSYFINARPSAVVLHGALAPSSIEDPLDALRRRWIAAMLAGVGSLRWGNTNVLNAELAALKRLGFATGAALLDAVSRTESAAGSASIDTFLATAIYLRTCRLELARSRATIVG